MIPLITHESGGFYFGIEELPVDTQTIIGLQEGKNLDDLLSALSEFATVTATN